MKGRIIHFVRDVEAAERFYAALGLRPQVRARTGKWIELAAAGGELDLHDSASAADGEGRDGYTVGFVADEPLEVVEQRLRDAGFPPDGTIIDQEWGRFSPTHPTAPLSRSTSKTPSSIHEKDGGHESTREEDMMATVSVRYIVDDVDAAIVFYTQHLGFDEVMHPAPTFAMLSRGDLRLNLSAPSGQGGGGQAMPDGTRPEPGGWNRFSLEVPDLDATVEQLHAAGVHFRNDIVTGVGGKQILLDDPSGNPVELFQPTRSEAALNTDS